MDINRLNNLTNDEFDPSLLIEVISVILAVLTGLLFTTIKIEPCSIATDFFEAIPEERCAKFVHEEVFRKEVKKCENQKDLKMGLKGGGNLKSRITKTGTSELTNGRIRPKNVEVAAVSGAGGYATDIDAVLLGAGGLKPANQSRIKKNSSAGIGYGPDEVSGFDNTGEEKPSITYSPVLINNPNEESAEGENPFISTSKEPLSTFSIDVDNASYNNILYYIHQNMLPPPSSIRIEEMINNFSYNYPDPSGSHPLSAITEVSSCPWELSHRILRIGIKGRRLPPQGSPPSNFVFLVDVSGSMGLSGKLPLFKQELRSFVSSLNHQDRISIITYAGEAGLHLASTPGNNTELIFDAIDRLKSGGSTAGCEGIQLAYRLANNNFIRNGNNRIILVTDGNFNVGESSEKDLVRLIEKKRGNGIYLTVIGMMVENDENEKAMERLANNGDGNFTTVYDTKDLQRVFSSMNESFFTVAKDVKIQVQFNPERVEAYRLIGYENRMLENTDFTDDTKDAGEIGAEQTVTALYEIVPAKQSDFSQLFCTVNIRYKNGNESDSRLMTSDVYDHNKQIELSSADYRFATAVTGLGLLLINSSHKGTCTYDAVIDLAHSAAGGPFAAERNGFIDVVKKCKLLAQGEIPSLN